MIWTTQPTLELLNATNEGTMVGHIGIEFIEIGEDFLKASMPVDHRTVQPYRILHGGASVTLAETIGSVASSFCVDWNEKRVVGLEINANHLRQAKEGSTVYGTVRPIKLGRKIQVWNIEIKDDKERLCCVSRLTMAVIDL